MACNKEDAMPIWRNKLYTNAAPPPSNILLLISVIYFSFILYRYPIIISFFFGPATLVAARHANVSCCSRSFINRKNKKTHQIFTKVQTPTNNMNFKLYMYRSFLFCKKTAQFYNVSFQLFN